MELTEHVERFALAWAKSAVRPSPTPGVIAHWNILLDEWSTAPDLPLFVRKHANNRGSEVTHPSGRKIVPTDNSPAHWAYTLASAGERPTLGDVRTWVSEDRIPIAMIHKSVEKPIAKYHCCISKAHDVNARGWKLAHVSAVGLNTRTPFSDLPLERLAQQFVRLMSPGNMFVVPMAWSGLAEIRYVIDAIASEQ